MIIGILVFCQGSILAYTVFWSWWMVWIQNCHCFSYPLVGKEWRFYTGRHAVYGCTLAICVFAFMMLGSTPPPLFFIVAKKTKKQQDLSVKFCDDIVSSVVSANLTFSDIVKEERDFASSNFTKAESRECLLLVGFSGKLWFFSSLDFLRRILEKNGLSRDTSTN